MNKARLEAFSDGVIAIIITIMVLELKIPHSSDFNALIPLLPIFVSYVLSFVYIGIYWGNHHHILHTIKKASPGILLSNLNLLFWLSLTPFATAWMGENHFDPNTVAVYGIVLLVTGLSFYIFLKFVEKDSIDKGEIKMAFKNLRVKGIISTIGYLVLIPSAYFSIILSSIIFIVIFFIWFIPEKSIEKAIKEME